jgi:hypothetical protein
VSGREEKGYIPAFSKEANEQVGAKLGAKTFNAYRFGSTPLDKNALV